jgi:hypothetical protein
MYVTMLLSFVMNFLSLTATTLVVLLAVNSIVLLRGHRGPIPSRIVISSFLQGVHMPIGPIKGWMRGKARALFARGAVLSQFWRLHCSATGPGAWSKYCEGDDRWYGSSPPLAEARSQTTSACSRSGPSQDLFVPPERLHASSTLVLPMSIGNPGMIVIGL